MGLIGHVNGPTGCVVKWSMGQCAVGTVGNRRATRCTTDYIRHSSFVVRMIFLFFRMFYGLSTSLRRESLTGFNIVFYKRSTFFYVRRALLYFACLGAKGISLCVAVRNGVIVVFNDCRILAFRVRWLGIITVDLPWVAGIKTGNGLRFLAFRATILRNGNYVPLFATTITIRCVGSSDCSNVRTRISPPTNYVGVMLVGNVSVSHVRFGMQVIA